jgi:hypothetical protein
MAQEERIMSRDLSNLDTVAQWFYELKQNQILQPLEKEMGEEQGKDKSI